jgi:hypothetical protein
LLLRGEESEHMLDCFGYVESLVLQYVNRYPVRLLFKIKCIRVESISDVITWLAIQIVGVILEGVPDSRDLIEVPKMSHNKEVEQGLLILRELEVLLPPLLPSIETEQVFIQFVLALVLMVSHLTVFSCEHSLIEERLVLLRHLVQANQYSDG